MEIPAVRLYNSLIEPMSDDAALTLLATSRAPQCRLRLDKRLDGYYTIQYLSSGSVELAYDDDWHTLAGGGWFWPAFPGPRLRFHVAPGCDAWFHRHVGFQGPLVQRWIADGLWPTGPQRVPPNRDWDAFFDDLIAQARRTDRWGRLRATNLLEQLLVELAEARAHPAEPVAEPWLATTLAHLDTTGSFGPDYAELGATLGMGVSTLRRRFKAAMGVTPHEFVVRRRIARARTLLDETDLTLAAVAAQLGYDNVYYFARQFRERVGVTPGTYRRSRHG